MSLGPFYEPSMTDKEVVNATIHGISDGLEVKGDEEEDESIFSIFSPLHLRDDLSDRGTQLETTTNTLLQDKDEEDSSLKAVMQRIGSTLQLLKHHGGFSDIDLDLVDGTLLTCMRTVHNAHVNNSQATDEHLLSQHKVYIKNELKDVHNLIVSHMGSMSLCRGRNGDTLRKAGAINSLLSLLYSIRLILISHSPSCEAGSDINDILYKLPLEVASSSLAALRDLACGNASNRNAVGSFSLSPFTNNWNCGNISDVYDLSARSKMTFQTHKDNTKQSTEPAFVLPIKKKMESDGIDILIWYIQRYISYYSRNVFTLPNTNHTSHTTISQLHQLTTETTTQHHLKDLNEHSKQELRLFTNALGVVRNITHSNRTNCVLLHERGMTDLFRIWLLRQCNLFSNISPGENRLSMELSYQRLPDATKPWREACYRMAGSLINMAEKCLDCAIKCTSPLPFAMENKDSCGINDDINGCDELIWILMESWGGVGIYHQSFKEDDRKSRTGGSTPVLHLGLAAILKQRIALVQTDVITDEKKAPSQALGAYLSQSQERQMLERTITHVLEREDERKLRAQERERMRKRCQQTKTLR